MLVLTRKIGEQFIINDDIVITLVSTKKNQARIGIKAPKHKPIVRKELIKMDDKNKILKPT